MNGIPGYTYGTSSIAKSPVTLADFERMKASVLFGEGEPPDEQGRDFVRFDRDAEESRHILCAGRPVEESPFPLVEQRERRAVGRERRHRTELRHHVEAKACRQADQSPDGSADPAVRTSLLDACDRLHRAQGLAQ